jgi:response regulator NasT
MPRASYESRAPRAAGDPIRVLVGEADPTVQGSMAELLGALGHQVLACTAGALETATRAALLSPDVVLLDVALLATDGPSAEDIAAAAPDAAIVLFCGDPDVRLSDREVGASTAIAYLPQPMPPGYLDAALRLAVRRGRALAEARHEAEEARRQLEHRKLIERAKGVLMRRTGTTEAEAYSILRRQSQDRSIPMVDIARAVLDSEPGQQQRAG